jgi:biotin carboxyl carrier protein
MEKATSESLKTFIVDGDKYRTLLSKKYTQRKPYQPQDPKKITAFIPGTIRKVFAIEGKKVKKGDALLILEAMKMNNSLISPLDGIIRKVMVETGQVVTKNQLLIEIE